MGLPSGRTNNSNGRPKGSPNKVTKELRKIIKDIMNDKLENIDQLFKQLSPNEKMKFLIELLPYCLPKLNSIDEKEPESNEEKLIEKFNNYFKKENV